jgi:AhpD family alkylhydroperoxidase
LAGDPNPLDCPLGDFRRSLKSFGISTDKDLRAMIRAVKISLCLAILFPAIALSVDFAVAETPPPTATPKVDPIEANDPEFSGNSDSLYQKTWGTGAIPEKYKQLTGVSISVMEKCETCLGWHTKQAVRLGGSKAELIEAIRLGVLTGGSITIPTARKGYELLGDLKVK